MVSLLSLQLFDSAEKRGLHSMGQKERELLKYAAFLHDVGDFISFTDHNLHSHYIIKNAELLGFDHQEVNMIANVAKYHTKKIPKKKNLKEESDPKTQKTINLLSGILRIAENLDRSHTQSIPKAKFTRNDKTEVTLTVWCEKDCELEKRGIESGKSLFKKTFGKSLKLNTLKKRASNKAVS